jgi:hypothetical protein
MFALYCVSQKKNVTKISLLNYDLAPINVIIDDLKFTLNLNFIEASVVFAPPICNKPAHELAALGVGVAHKYHVELP